ncbi:MAG: AAA family ATPase [Deltaproteobacteria bacterium]|nr:AAA family ATPase [Deltaproteobacteria bacterium]
MHFIGREDEIRLLRKTNFRDHADLTVMYGRRRVGKTALIEKAYHDCVMWKFEGLEQASPGDQINSFLNQLALYAPTKKGKTYSANDWGDAFLLLSKTLNNKKVVVFFDEFQWMVGMDAKIVSLFKYYWDNHFQKHRSCRFVICGSVSSFIVEQVIHSQALYGRIDTEIHLKPLSLKESRLFFSARTAEEVLQIYMTFGGVPKYLLEIEPGRSFLQNLNETAFHQNGFFFQEYRRLFISHFAENTHYQTIVRALSQKQATLDDLAKACQTKKGGVFSDHVNNLVLADFVERFIPLGKSDLSRIVRFRLLDEYLHFYFGFILPNAARIQSGQFQYQGINEPTLRQWQGYAFERLCRRHAREIAKRLFFAGVAYASGTYFERKKNGVQVDLVFKRNDNVLTVCEVKYVNTLQGKALVDTFQKKIRTLSESFPRYSIHKVLILGKENKIPDVVKSTFDQIIYASEI